MRNCHSEFSGYFEIYDQLKLRRLLDWKFLRFDALEQAIDVSGRATLQMAVIGSIGQKQSRLTITTPRRGGRDAVRQSHVSNHITS